MMNGGKVRKNRARKMEAISIELFRGMTPQQIRAIKLGMMGLLRSTEKLEKSRQKGP